MIQEPTVFVLGAGASMPYGFPSGKKLRDDVVTALAKVGAPRQRSFLNEALRAAGFLPNQIVGFATALTASRCETVDEFVQLEVAEPYVDVARAAIAASLIPLETQNCINTRDEHKDNAWYGYLLTRILPVNPAVPTNLRVVTLNFDRSFDQAAYQAICARYRDADQGLIQKLVPIVHFHGHLEPGFPSSHVLGSYQPHRPDRAAMLASAVLQSAKRIRLVSEGPHDEQVAQAREWLAQARVLCFLGFGFHRFTLTALGIKSLLQQPTRPRICGTTLGLDTGRKLTLSGELGQAGVERLLSKSIRQFLEDDPLIQWPEPQVSSPSA